MYQKGQWVSQDLNQALQYFREAANLGEPLAKRKLARMVHVDDIPNGIDEADEEPLAILEPLSPADRPDFCALS